MEECTPISSSSAFSIPTTTLSHQNPSRRLPALPANSMGEFAISATLLAMQRSRPGFSPHSVAQSHSPPQLMTQGLSVSSHSPPSMSHGITSSHALPNVSAWTSPGMGVGGIGSVSGIGGVGGAGEDPFMDLRKHNLATKEAWTAIPASEGFKILDACRSLSATSSSLYVLSPSLSFFLPQLPQSPTIRTPSLFASLSSQNKPSDKEETDERRHRTTLHPPATIVKPSSTRNGRRT